MQEVFEKLIKKLEEKKLEHSVNGMQHEDSEVFLLEREEYGKFQGLKEAIEIVKQAAEEFATDTNVGTNGWISCSERLPEYDGTYVCTCKGLSETVALLFSKHDNSWMDEFDGEYEDVTAWQPLPEPYQTNICDASDCPFNDGMECPAAEGCAGYEPKGE